MPTIIAITADVECLFPCRENALIADGFGAATAGGALAVGDGVGL